MPGPGWVTSNKEEQWGARTHGNLSEEETFFVENSDRAETIAESSDPFADYSYDNWALAVLDGKYYVFNTSGCSCPSPSETWSLIFSGDEPALLKYLDQDKPYEAFAEFLREIEQTGKLQLKSPAPEPRQNRYDW